MTEAAKVETAAAPVAVPGIKATAELKRKEFLAVLDKVREAVPSSDVVPLLNHFLIRNGEVMATDLDIGVSAAYPALSGFDCLAPAEKLYTLVKNLPHETLKLTQDGDKLTLSGKGHKSTIKLNPLSKDFPVINTADRNWVKIPTDFHLALEVNIRTVDEQRPELSGICWGEHGLVSSDSTRVTSYKLDGENPKPNVLLSAKLSREVIRQGKPTEYSVAKGVVAFKYDKVMLTGRLIDSQFPEKWPNFYPKERPTCVKIGAEAIESLKRVGTFSGLSEDKPLSELSFDDGNLLMSYSGVDQIEERVKTETAQDWKFTLNPVWLAEAMKSCSGFALSTVGTRQILYCEGYDGKLRIVMAVAVKPAA